MRVKPVTRSMFVIWIVTVAVLAVVPHADDGLMVASNVTPSGMEKHIVGYFVGVWLLYYWVWERRKAQGEEMRGQKTDDRRPRSEVRGQGSEASAQKSKERTQRTEGSYICLCGLVIFGYSVVLEFVQVFLPYRTLMVS